MKLLLKENRVQIRVAEVTLENGKYKAVKGKFKSMTVFDTTAEEVFDVIVRALKSKCEELK